MAWGPGDPSDGEVGADVWVDSLI
eukprot:COSAG06_NODE_49728_length_323_cov_0.919643_1_plen_23_part_01